MNNYTKTVFYVRFLKNFKSLMQKQSSLVRDVFENLLQVCEFFNFEINRNETNLKTGCFQTVFLLKYPFFCANKHMSSVIITRSTNSFDIKSLKLTRFSIHSSYRRSLEIRKCPNCFCKMWLRGTLHIKKIYGRIDSFESQAHETRKSNGNYSAWKTHPTRSKRRH